MSRDKMKSAVLFEMGQIDQLFESYNQLLEKSKEYEPDLIELTALASVLHSFYNGVENIFMQIAKKVDGFTPNNNHWHRNLLLQMAAEQDNRKPVISEEVKLRLADYLGFRHFYRHSYSFFLSWGEMEKLVQPLGEVWNQLRKELSDFLKINSDET
ncbi:MAG: hypothetical protein KAX49_16240 [Halanaerobiales bacterium]|nr:hypothetical protein [Halanaerobiales bacterium]